MNELVASLAGAVDFVAAKYPECAALDVALWRWRGLVDDRYDCMQSYGQYSDMAVRHHVTVAMLGARLGG